MSAPEKKPWFNREAFSIAGQMATKDHEREHPLVSELDGPLKWVFLAVASYSALHATEPVCFASYEEIGKRAGAWALDTDAPEATRGFLLNHLITELLPEREGGYRFSNSDPITGQAAWYDLRVSIEKCAPEEAKETAPRFEPTKLKLLVNGELEPVS